MDNNEKLAKALYKYFNYCMTTTEICDKTIKDFMEEESMVMQISFILKNKQATDIKITPTRFYLVKDAFDEMILNYNDMKMPNEIIFTDEKQHCIKVIHGQEKKVYCFIDC